MANRVDNDSKIVSRFILKTEWEAYINGERLPPLGYTERNFLKICAGKNKFFDVDKNDYYRVIISMHITGM